MLTRLYANNYKCLVNFEIRLGSIQLLLGGNGSGKSSVFEVLALLRDFCARGEAPDRTPPATRFGGAALTRWMDGGAQQFELDVTGNGGEYKFCLELDSWGNPLRPRVVKEEVSYSGQTVFRFVMGEVSLFNDAGEQKVKYPFDWHRSALATIAERPENTKLTWFKRWLGRILFLQPNPWAMSAIAEDDEAIPNQHLTNFANWFRHMRLVATDGTQNALTQDLRAVLEGFEGFRLEMAGQRRHEVRVLFTSESALVGTNRATEYNMDELSEGQRVLIALYATLHFAMISGALVCLDEPDNFVTPREVQPWLESVMDRVHADEGGPQVLIASHHPHILNYLAVNEGLLFDRPAGRHARVRPFSDPALTGLTPDELVARGWERE